MANRSLCFEKELVIETASVDKVVKVCEEALKGMGLKVTKEERHKDGTTSVMAKERAFIPLTMRVLSYPFSLGEYIKSAQRAGLHVVISPCGDGVRVLSCGIALDEVSGKPATYTKEETIEEITDFMEATDFENKFINKIKAAFPNYRDVKQEE